jgi:hypothetical protein
MIAEVFTMHDRFASNAVMSSVNLLSALFTPFLDRYVILHNSYPAHIYFSLLPHLIYTHVLSPARLLLLLRLTTNNLFPNGYPSPPPQIPTQAEQVQLRQALIHRLSDIISRSSLSSPLAGSAPGSSSRSRPGTGYTRGLLGRVLLGPTERGREEVIESVLDGLGDRRCNMHLVLFILDAVVLRVFPELGVGAEAPESMSRSVSGAMSLTPPG